MNLSEINSFVTDIDEGKKILLRQAKRFKQCLINAVNDYYSSYTPKIYQRTFGLRDSIEIDDIVKIENNYITINVGWYGEGAWGQSLFGYGMEVYKPNIISFGWQVKNAWFKNIYRFGYYEGYGDLLSKAIDEFYSDDTEGVTIISIDRYKYS